MQFVQKSRESEMLALIFTLQKVLLLHQARLQSL
nr:MAG TPA: hypothetical protein [Caudoviricetes sp.]